MDDITFKQKFRYNERLKNFICQNVADGNTLLAVYEKYKDALPPYDKLLNFLESNEEYYKEYLSALDVMYRKISDKLLMLADEETPRHFEKDEALLYEKDRKAKIDIYKYTLKEVAKFLSKTFENKKAKPVNKQEIAAAKKVPTISIVYFEDERPESKEDKS